MEPSNQEAAEELAELKHLQHQQLTAKIGISGLQIEELHGELQGYVVRLYHKSPYMHVGL